MLPEIEAQYAEFLKNPQQVGAWCLRVKLTERVRAGLQTLLNMEEWYFRGNIGLRRKVGYDDYPADFPPSPLIRLFAYLRACLPKKLTSELPALAAEDSAALSSRTRWSRRRFDMELKELATTPIGLSQKKVAALKKAAKIYEQHFSHFRCVVVPENSGKVDFRDNRSRSYFQATQEPHGVLKILPVQEDILPRLRELLESLPGIEIECEIIRAYSPESVLMELYVPVVHMLRPDHILVDVAAIKNATQSLDEIGEGRFVHAIRATGIAVEELLVEIYETYTHEKAPSSPLGELLSSLQSRLKEVAFGQKRQSQAPLDPKKLVGEFITAEKGKSHPNQAAIDLAQVLQKAILPLVGDLVERVSDVTKNSQREMKVSLFPLHV